ncbi:hypothetical protein FGIG_09934 [Fasciola gigantica]|uniref:SUEL-type lectin domain-containing protein n=1 Tax=Fasciola gigantica TaxID=46835 RepID=A0A504Z474_FASGI|nr:hypothetical protein FGIG_09934 [Fasciola gigantica]
MVIRETKGEPVAIDPLQRVKCATNSIVALVQQLCQGMNTCDIVRKLSRMDTGVECQHVTFLRVNYTCFPAYSQQEVVCADSYVELSCTSVGTEATLLLLQAKLGLNPTTEAELHSNGKSKHCANAIDHVNCKPVDVSALTARNCNRRAVCTVNPAMITDQLRKQSDAVMGGRINSTSQEEPQMGRHEQDLTGSLGVATNCAKSNLYLEYTCAHTALLRPVTRTNAVHEKRRLNKSLQPVRHQLTEALESEHPKGASLVSLESLVQNTGPVFDRNSLRNPVANPASSEIIHDGSNVLLISLIPSIICLLLVSILVAYVVYTKRTTRQNQWVQKPYQSDKCGANFPSQSDKLVTLDSVNQDVPIQSTGTLNALAERTRLLMSLKDRILWTPLELRRASNSLNESVCCECSRTDCEPPCTTSGEVRLSRDGTVSQPVTDCLCQNSVQATSLAKSTTHSLSNTQTEFNWGPGTNQACQVCSMKSSTVGGNNIAACHQVGSCNLKGDDAPKAPKHSGLYTSFPTKYFPEIEQKVVSSAFDATMNWTQYGYARPRAAPEHKPINLTASPLNPRAHSNRTPGVGNHELYQSMIRSSSQSHPQNPQKSADQRLPPKVAPPLFNSSDKFSRSLTESYQPKHVFNLRFTKIPVVRYPYEAENDSEGSSHSINRDSPNVRVPGVGSLLRQNRPDLCPPIKVENKSSVGSPGADAGSPKKTILLSSRDQAEYNENINNSVSTPAQLNSSPSVVDSRASPDYTMVEEYKSSSTVSVSPRPYPRLLSDVSSSNKISTMYPSPKPSKQLRFQTSVPELPHTVYDHNNVLSPCDMSTSMCRSTRQT